MSTFVAVILTVFFLAVILGLLERAHRHGSGVPHEPLGGDPDHDADLQRVLHDLEVHRV